MSERSERPFGNSGDVSREERAERPMSKIFKGVRPGDIVLAVLMTALGVVLMVANIKASPTDATRIDSRSWALVPVFAAAALPILWRRRNMLAVLAVTVAALAVHVVAFGWVVRCGAGLPLAFALAYGAGRLSERTQAIAGLVAVIGVQFLVLIKDSAAGLGIIPVTAVISAAAWGVGVWLRQRAATSETTETPAPVSTYA